MQSKNDLSLDEIIELAKKVTLEQGTHIPQLFVVGRNGSGIVALPEMPEDFDNKQKMFGMAGVKIGAEAGLGMLTKLYFVTEAWISVMGRKQAEAGKYVRPSQDPKRKEVLLISGINIDEMKTEMAVLEMIRDKKGKLIDLKEMDDTKGSRSKDAKIESPLLDAFVMGYQFAYAAKLSQEVNTKADKVMEEIKGIKRDFEGISEDLKKKRWN